MESEWETALARGLVTVSESAAVWESATESVTGWVLGREWEWDAESALARASATA
jgi:hypothetical protein